ncbi:MAG: hypothetical protein HDR80_00455 [Bacteroides sp.]|nr:hypothetical protein [Bacteroides sp.]
MSEHINPGDMVEGQKTKIIARKIEFKKRSLQKHEITKKNMVSYSLDRNCSVEVIEEIGLSEEEIRARENLPIFRTVGDVLKADAIRLHVAGMRDLLGGSPKEGVSHRHGATVVDCPIHTLAKIQTPWQGHLALLGMTSTSDEPKKLK